MGSGRWRWRARRRLAWRQTKQKARLYWRRLTPAIAWDAFMVYLAILNVGLIVFDFSYLWLRPVYFQYLPIVTSVYDPVKGITPHEPTSRYLAAVDSLGGAVGSGASTAAVSQRLDGVHAAQDALFSGDPFDRSGQSRNLAKITARTRLWLKEETGSDPGPLEARELLRRFWSTDEAALAERLRFFRDEIRQLLAVNYHRDFDLSGELVDYFWLIDLPFLALFTLEFLIRWGLAHRDRRYPRWFLFPIFNWYDLLGIVPIPQMRFFRLFRIASIYVRLHRSERSAVGDDIVSRTIAYVANIVSEEISDMVSLRILNESQIEIRDGTHRRIIREVATPRRDALARELTDRLCHVLVSQEVRQRVRAFLDLNFDRAVESSEALERIPLPNGVLRPLVTIIGDLIFDVVSQTLAATLETEEGRAALEELVGASIDGLIEELTEGELEVLVREISLDALEHVEEAVRVRKWVEAEVPIRLSKRGVE